MKNQTKAYFYALTTVCLWATIASASKLSLRYLTPAKLLLIASVISTTILFLIVLYQRKIKTVFHLLKTEWKTSLSYGVLNPFGYYLVLFKAYELLPAQQAQIINYTWAITISLLSIPLLRQKVTGKQWVAIIVSYAGVLVIATRGELLSLHFDEPLGVALALLSTIIWALYWILNTRDKREPVVGLFLNFCCAVPLITLYVYMTEGFQPVTVHGLVGAAYIGVFEMGVAFVLWLKAMKHTDNTAKIANMIFLAPIASLVLIHYLVGEEIYRSTLVGLVLVITGLGIQATTKPA